MSIITTNNLTKEYSTKFFGKKKILALNDFSFTVEEGEIFGLLGPNGAGKTTLIKLLLGIVFPTRGDAEIFGKKINDESYKSRIGYLPENHRFPNYMTGGETLVHFAKLSGMEWNQIPPKVDEMLKLVDLEKWKKTKIKNYSKGMMQRLGLAQSIINNPDLVFLDEPTDGVDPIGRKEIRDILIDLKNKGKTIFLNSHLLSEIELVCDRVAILNKGILIKEGKVSDIATYSDTYIFETSDLQNEVLNKLLTSFSITLSGTNLFRIKTTDINVLNNLIDFLRTEKILIHSIVKEKNTLEDMFINLIENR
jgi:ABC-2 type transport system ATP-binding protein